jgi:hypothetical protein
MTSLGHPSLAGASTASHYRDRSRRRRHGHPEASAALLVVESRDRLSLTSRLHRWTLRWRVRGITGKTMTAGAMPRDLGGLFRQ